MTAQIKEIVPATTKGAWANVTNRFITAKSMTAPIAPTKTSGYRSDLPDLGKAPELSNEVWLNTDRPLRLSDLRGKVVLIDMWTFG
jgi:hypothetical protein